jgi:O-acetylserine/cysteine efflux transporter
VVKEVSVFTTLILRFMMVSILLFPLLLKIPSKKDFFYLLIATLAVVPGHFGLLFMSLQETSSVSGVSVLIQLAIPFSIVLAWIFYREKPSILRIIGLTISFCGIVILLYDPSLLDNKNAFILAILSALSLGSYFVLIKKIKGVKSLSLVAWTSFLGIPMMYCMMILNNQSFDEILTIKSNLTYYSFIYVVVGSSIMGHGIWIYLVKTQDINFISPFLLLIPLVTTFLSAIIFQEEITRNFIIISSIIVFGTFLVFISKNITQELKEVPEDIS